MTPELAAHAAALAEAAPPLSSAQQQRLATLLATARLPEEDEARNVSAT